MREGKVSEGQSVDRVNADVARRGKMGQRYLASGESVSMRLWDS